MASLRFHENFEYHTWLIIFAFSFLCCMVLTAVIIYSIKKFCFSKEGKKINTNAKILSILSLSCFLLAQIMQILYTYFVKLAGVINNQTEAMWGYFNSIWAIGYFFIYLLFFIRLKGSFKGTKYAIRKCPHIIFAILISSYLIVEQADTFIWLYYVFFPWTWSWHEYNQTTIPLLCIRLSVNAILNIYILYLFWSKLRKSFANEQSREVNDVVVKLFILTLSTVVSTTFYTISQILNCAGVEIAYKADDYQLYYWTYILYFILSNIDMLVSAMYVLLSFSFMDSHYQACCKCVHVKCIKLCPGSSKTSCLTEQAHKSPETNSTFDPEFTSTFDMGSSVSVPLKCISPSSKAFKI